MAEKTIKTLLIIPPFSQINTPYPSAGQLSGFLKSRGYQAKALDLSLIVTKRIFSKSGLDEIFSLIAKKHNTDEFIIRALELSENYKEVIDPVINFLQGKNPNLAYRIIKEDYLPQGGAFTHGGMSDFEVFGYLGIQDKAKYYCSLLIDDLTKIIQETITSHFGLCRYAEKIAVSPAEFDPILSEFNREPNLIEKMIVEETVKAVGEYSPDLIGYSIPFPGNFLGALKSAKHVKDNFPLIKIVFGGGYINTELRKLKDKRLFDFTDYITYDDGELPLLNIIKNLSSESSNKLWVRTLIANNGKLELKDDAVEKNLDHNNLPSPNLDGIDAEEYISMVEMLNPMHRLWSDGYWNKLSVAHGCYWRKCTFCDTTLDYIGRYSPAKASTVVDWMEHLIKHTGRTSFHFTDEAAPPSLLKEIAIEILKRNLPVTWWGNIRFEKSFSRDLCKLLSISGCIAVSGGLEVADERLLEIIKKGVTLKQVAGVCSNFQNAGIMVHAYLMYGFPSQTEQEIINSLELVRQFVQLRLFQSGFWHRFSLTAHSPIAQEPEKFGIEIKSSFNNPFANNDMLHNDLTKVDHSKFSKGLSKALYNYMQGIGLEWDVVKWFDFRVPKPTVQKNLIRNYLIDHLHEEILRDNSQVFWNGGKVEIKSTKKKGICKVIVNTNSISGQWETNYPTGEWIKDISLRLKINSGGKIYFSQLKSSFPGGSEQFNSFSGTKIWKELRGNILLFV